MKKYLILTLLFAFSVNAEIPRVLENPSPRSYKVDQFGHQIFDQVAELETAVENLQLQNSRLQEELKEKQALINTLSQAASVREKESVVKEKDLFASSEQCQKKIDKLNSELSLTKNKLYQQSNAEGKLLSRLEERELKIYDLEKSLYSIKKRKQENGRARLADPSDSKRSLKEVKLDLKKSIQNINTLVLERKRRWDYLKNSNTSVQIKLSDLADLKGESLDSIRLRAKKITPKTNIKNLEKSLREIEDLLLEDIGLIKRISGIV